ncbi:MULTISPECIES: 4a-hydroxytetrahydrobiopterin dehydratase [Bradyrhizobium]|jgi:pterin-4a-carbinolamine dehydratase|uniref:4a-hydroxytetrahydrobiopterin dehydratase n=3 Tax=Bradyrhizobium TaxID=374 RepID=A0ABS5G7J3_9BRAD|nr:MULTISPECIES: 4a-hydroxytetrahydrobiopterin dehydratase [Bradyrhizobium]RTM04630.1 MAG: hypothetical protein EKK32_05360 [Bradyrhizobiaceae bacterium]MBR1137034.1 4a-hydroxytetrahydrobiopterin dehydratase [Bradyrhizobium denitrificans]MDU0958253.1 4a-hydroxytetrahydrobiopterin dehydratase [Bradyrhizobium sp.]MDU1492640.1 4a-hydroxytetrahydrobiopterin dehydratase [Bradyrhizobium sp.]MDU1542825.1 4a-hydroxytetrahydrobiopterin dehydratase [Bradyrhizobium sp.]
MQPTIELPEAWKAVSQPPSLFCRYEFKSYAQTREFLDGLAVLSEETRLFPDLGFARTFVNITLRGRDGAAPGVAEIDYARRAAVLAAAWTGP